MTNELLYKELTYQINGAAMDVHKALGCGFLEKVYQEAFAIALQERGLPFQREKPISVFYHGHQLHTPYFCDFMVDNKIIVELKAVKNIEAVHYAQILNYLRATGLKLGIIFNFNDVSIHPIRVLNAKAL